MALLRGAAQLFSLITGSAALGQPACAAATRLLNTAGHDGGNAGPPSYTATADLAPGTVFTLSKRYSLMDVASFAAMTGDGNAIHVDAAAAKRQGLPGPILPGLLVASLFPAIIGSHFPGALYLSQSLKFKNYALLGDSVTATLTVERSGSSRVAFNTLCCNTISGQVLIEGKALALIRRQQQPQQQPKQEQQHPQSK